MAKRRYNAKKIANTPSLKRGMAEFCAQVDVEFGANKDDLLLQALYKGHRGYISYSEDDLAKEFDKRINLLRDAYSKAKAEDDETKERWKHARSSEKFTKLELWYEEGVKIADQVFEDKFLA